MLCWRSSTCGGLAVLFMWLITAPAVHATPDADAPPGGETSASTNADSPADAVGSASPEGTPADAGTNSPLQTCENARYLVLTLGPRVPASLAEEIRTDLAAELAPQGIGVCVEERSEPAPLALVSVSIDQDSVSIELDDRTTFKRVARDVRLRGVPENGRALATAIAVDELLRASWAELALARPDAEPSPPANAPADAEAPPEPARPAPDARPRTLGLALATGFLQAARSWNMFSLGLRATLWPVRWAWVEAGASLLRSLRVEAPLGEVAASGVSTDLTLGTCLLQTPRAFGCMGVRGGVDRVRFTSRADERRATARTASGTAVRLEGVGSLGVSLPRGMLVFAQLSLGAPLQAVLATDSRETLMGLQGLFWSGALGFGVER